MLMCALLKMRSSPADQRAGRNWMWLKIPSCCQPAIRQRCLQLVPDLLQSLGFLESTSISGRKNWKLRSLAFKHWRWLAPSASVCPCVKCVHWTRYSLASRMFTEYLLCAKPGAGARTFSWPPWLGERQIGKDVIITARGKYSNGNPDQTQWGWGRERAHISAWGGGSLRGLPGEVSSGLS